MLSPALQLKNIVKYYQHVKALDNVSIDVAPGSIHGIIGENGAGKSTLLKVAYGLLAQDEGDIFVDGVQVTISNPQQAVDNGIGMLHQATSWLEQQSILDNILLGEDTGFFFTKGRHKARLDIEQLCREFGFSFSLDTLISQLDYSQRQMVDILRSLYRGAKVLILDEPMALLSPSQSTYLFDLLAVLKMQGISILMVAHKLSVLHQLCDVISVMSQGKLISHVNPKNMTLGALSKLMIGREITLPHPNTSSSECETIERLKLTNLSLKERGHFGLGASSFSLSNIDLSIESHEIVAFTGLSKAGHEQLLAIIAGLNSFSSGRISINKKRFKPHTHYDVKMARQLGIAYVPDPLSGIGVVKALPMYESAMLGYQSEHFSHYSLRQTKDNREYCHQLMQTWDVRPDNPDLLTGAFSGGNQQKMVLAREISSQPDLLLLNHPSNGLDVGAIESIYQRLFELRDTGTSVIFCSNDLDEIMSLSDRVVLFERGQIIGQYYTQHTNKSDLSLMLANEVVDD